MNLNQDMILFLFGADIWRKAQKIAKIREKFAKEVDPSRLNCVVLEVAETDEEKLCAAFKTAPFLARKRLVILKNFLTNGRKAVHEVLEAYLKDPATRADETTILVISEDQDKPKKDKDWRTQTAKVSWEYLEKNVKFEAFPLLSGAKLEAAIAAQAKAQELILTSEAGALLSVLSAGDLGYTAQEIAKLGSYCQGRAVTTEDVKVLCCTAQGEANIFEFLDALGNKQLKELLRTAQEQLQETDPFQLLSRVSTHLYGLLTLKIAGEAGARALNLHPFQLRKMTTQLRHWDTLTLKQFLFKLLTLEYSAKRGLTADLKTQLTALLAQAVNP